MSRPVFSFRPNMDNPEHRQAWEVLKNVPDGRKNAFVARAILQAECMEHIEKVIRKTVREELKCGSVAQSELDAVDDEIPKPMLDFLDSL